MVIAFKHPSQVYNPGADVQDACAIEFVLKWLHGLHQWTRTKEYRKLIVQNACAVEVQVLETSLHTLEPQPFYLVVFIVESYLVTLA